MKPARQQQSNFDVAFQRCLLGRGVDCIPPNLATAVQGMRKQLRTEGAPDPAVHASDGVINLCWPNFTLNVTLASDGVTVFWSVPEVHLAGIGDEFNTCVTAFKALKPQ